MNKTRSHVLIAETGVFVYRYYISKHVRKYKVIRSKVSVSYVIAKFSRNRNFCVKVLSTHLIRKLTTVPV